MSNTKIIKIINHHSSPEEIERLYQYCITNFRYDPDSGIVTWLTESNRSKRLIGDRVGCVSKSMNCWIVGIRLNHHHHTSVYIYYIELFG